VVGSWSSGSHATVRWGSGVRVARAVGRATVLLGVAGPLLLAGCGDDAAGGDRAASGSNETTDDRRDDEPLATNPEAVAPYIENLLDEHNYVVDQVLADLEVAGDAQDPLTERYLALFAPDSDVPDRLLDEWAEMSARGERFEPHEPGQPINTVRLDGDVEAVNEGEVRFPICNDLQFRRVDASGQVIVDYPPRQHRGRGFAQHVAGEWRLWRIDTYSDTSGCPSSGGS
jgi:hypothetical protein